MNAGIAAPEERTWLPTLVLLLALIQGSSLTLSLAFHFRDVSGVLEPAVNGLWALLYSLSLLGLMTRFGINWLSWLLRFRLPLVVVLAGVMLSSLWSIDTALTIERGVHLLGTSLAGLYIGLSVSMTRLLRITAVFLGALLLLSAAAALFYPALGLEEYQGSQVWRGVTASKNTLGFWAASAVLLYASLWFCPPEPPAEAQVPARSVDHLPEPPFRPSRHRLILALGVVLALVVLAYSGSATSLLAMISGGLLMAYLAIASRWRLGLAGTVALGLLASALAMLAFMQIDTAELIGRSRDLTGRSEVWQQTWQLILNQPLTGYGYGTLWFPTDGSLWIQESLTHFNWIVYHAHNGLLQVASEIGLPLTLLTIVMVVLLLIEVIHGQYTHGSMLTLFVPGFLLTLLVSNYAEARLLVNRELYWILFLALPVALLNVQRPLQAGNALSAMMPALPEAVRRKTLSIAGERRHRRALKSRLRHRRDAEARPVTGLLTS